MKLLMLLLLVSCVTAAPPVPENVHQLVDGQSVLYKYRDEDNGVTCYRIAYVDSVSCVRDNP